MAEKFILPRVRSGYFGCEKLGRMVPVEACRVHSQGLVKDAYASEHVLENCKGCTDWRVADAPAGKPKARRLKLTPPSEDKAAGRKKLSL